jgi:hypothetical protein
LHRIEREIHSALTEYHYDGEVYIKTEKQKEDIDNDDIVDPFQLFLHYTKKM